jgi:hypothetical protein
MRAVYTRWQALLDLLPTESTGTDTTETYRWAIVRRTSSAERGDTDAIGVDCAADDVEKSMRSASTGGGWPF